MLLARLPEEQRASVLSIEGGGGGEKSYKSIVVAGEDRTWLNSAACLRIGRELRGPLRYLALLAGLVPVFIRDQVEATPPSVAATDCTGCGGKGVSAFLFCCFCSTFY